MHYSYLLSYLNVILFRSTFIADDTEEPTAESLAENSLMSEYEVLRMKRMQRNKQQFAEHMTQFEFEGSELYY